MIYYVFLASKFIAKEHVQSLDVSQMAILCDLEPECVGFLSNGFLKAAGGKEVPYEGVSFYGKK